MTTPDPFPGLTVGDATRNADLDTPVIAQLIRELFAEGREANPVPGLPASLRPVPTSLGGAYSAAASPHEVPVHPGSPTLRPVGIAGPPRPLAESVSGAHAPGASQTLPFGEPRCPQAQPTSGAREPTDGISPSPDVAPRSEAPAPDNNPNASWFYFLPDHTGRSPSVEAGGPGHPPTAVTPFFDVQTVRQDFPALHQTVNGRPLIWLDNAATTHKPRSVIEATSGFYSRDNSNIHRAAHTLAARATELYEGGREKVRRFLGAADAREIVFVRGTTEAINLVAQTYGRKFVSQGDEILLTTMEHHANIVPWQLLAEQTGAVIRVAPINDSGELILDHFAALLSPRTKLVAVTHVANALGTVNPVEQIIALAHAYGVPVLLDAAQSTPHLPVNVQALDVDFLAFSGHKVFGPTGIGALYGKAAWLDQLPPWQGGGNMIRDVTFAKTSYQEFPQKFEAGTQDIAGVVGLGAALDYLLGLGLPAIAAYEHDLLEYATAALAEVPGLRPVGTAAAKASVLSFVLEGLTPEQVGQHLDHHGIAVRSGHHCAQPALRRFGLESTVRPSLAFYNTREEIDALARALQLLRRR